MPARPWSTYEILTVSPSSIAPDVGFSSPMIILKSVDLPTPLGPITPTMPLRGRLKERSSMSTRPSNSLCRCSTSSTFAPKRGPTGMRMSVQSSFWLARASASISS